mgnify:CR=1 FL=1
MTDWLVGAYGPDMDGHARGVVKLTSRDDGGLRPVEGFLIEAPSPAFLARGHGGVYAALEGSRAVVTLDSGERFDSGGQWPCHIGVYGDSVVVTNYFDGSIVLATGQVLDAEPGRGPRGAQSMEEAIQQPSRRTPYFLRVVQNGAARLDFRESRHGNPCVQDRARRPGNSDGAKGRGDYGLR